MNRDKILHAANAVLSRLGYGILELPQSIENMEELELWCKKQLIDTATSTGLHRRIQITLDIISATKAATAKHR